MADLSAGVMLLDIDGTIVEVLGSFSVQPNAVTREAVVSESGVVSVKTTPVAPMVKATVLVMGEITGAWLASIVNKRGSVRLRDGRVYAFDGLTSTASFEHNAIDGTVDLEFFMQKCIETA